MNHWDGIRLRARRLHQRALELSSKDVTAAALLAAAEEMTAIPRQGLPAGHPLLYKSKAALHSGQVWFNRDLELWEQHFNQAHEYAHHWCHGEEEPCDKADFDAEASEDAVALGAKRVDGYSPHERRELEANVFAREFLLPGDRLRDEFLAGKTAGEIASEVGLPAGLVIHQLSRALLGGEIVRAKDDGSVGGRACSVDYILDESQRSAAHAGWDDEHRKPAPTQRPVLVDAGPGTGKTRALVGRIVHLLEDRGTPPSRILALTYSNKAAEEIYSRVKAAVARDTVQVCVGTFHSFGLELVRKYFDRLGLKAKPRVIDQLDAQLMLERSLGQLDLEHYRYLPNPSRDLGAILKAISRAKDELVGPDEYARLAADEMAAAGNDEKARRIAARAQEVARVYRSYDQLLRRHNCLDYGDLIFLAVRLLREHADVRQKLQQDYEHILVDEYQDVNTGSRMMLKSLAGDGRGLWVVGDLRQAIYRFRGAAPINMRLFASEDFPAASIVQLKGNYRSQRPIVDLFEHCAVRMRAATDDSNRAHQAWAVKRAFDGGEVTYRSTADEDAEAEALVEEIERLRALGVEYRDQAVLCRQHDSLACFSAALERAGIPVLYLGNFFERPEIRDLLCVISLTCERDGRALFRLAKFPEYALRFADALALKRFADEHQIFFPDALKHLDEVTGLSSEGKQKLRRLAEHFAGFHYGSSPWTVLAHYLFGRGNYLRLLVANENAGEKEIVEKQQKRLAIYQFLLLAYQLRDRFDDEPGDKKQHFLNHILRLKINREEAPLRQTPDWADEINAVRMLTIHASKGLEFRAVHLPGLGEGKFPSGKRPDRCPPPAGLLGEEMREWEGEEEECLFFVAISRAKDYLCISRARQYGKRESRESSLLQLVRGRLPKAVVRPTTSVVVRREKAEKINLQTAAEPFDERALRDYLVCPLKYYYQQVLKISDRRSDSPYAQSHLCVHRMWQFIEREMEASRSIDDAALMRAFEDTWKDFGPVGHAYEADYRRDAASVVRRTLARRSAARALLLRPIWVLKTEAGEIIVRPDYVEVNESSEGQSILIQDLHLGSMPRKAPSNEYYALYAAAAEQVFPDAKINIQAVYVASGEMFEVIISGDKRKAGLRVYQNAIRGIQRGEFSPRPTEKGCPRCPGYHLCPAAEPPA